MNSNSTFEELQRQMHQNLVDFLRTELKLGFTFAKTAELEASMQNRQHFERARQHAESAIESIRRFEPRIKEPEVLEEIQRGADELQGVLARLRH